MIRSKSHSYPQAQACATNQQQAPNENPMCHSQCLLHSAHCQTVFPWKICILQVYSIEKTEGFIYITFKFASLTRYMLKVVLDQPSVRTKLELQCKSGTEELGYTLEVDLCVILRRCPKIIQDKELHSRIFQ